MPYIGPFFDHSDLSLCTMISTMKQEDSFLKWASSVLGEPVSNIKAVQDVLFVKRLLCRIDDLYFQEWGSGQ